jgi:hypothetical protein
VGAKGAATTYQMTKKGAASKAHKGAASKTHRGYFKMILIDERRDDPAAQGSLLFVTCKSPSVR